MAKELKNATIKLNADKRETLDLEALYAIAAQNKLDVKPYMPPFDRVDDVKMPPWVVHFMDGYF